MPFYRQPVTLKKASTLAILAAIQARPYSEINSCLNIASLRELVLLVHSWVMFNDLKISLFRNSDTFIGRNTFFNIRKQWD